MDLIILKNMKFLSLFSGIEAASVAWKSLGWECVGMSEVEPFACALLKHHYPNVPNFGDVTKITEDQIKKIGRIDVVVFGSPCQDLSVSGKRKGFINATDGTVTRSGLFFDAINIFQWARKHCGARFALWENVLGAYSSSKGKDFASVVSFMAGIDDVTPPPNGWGKEGCALGDNGMLEWSCLDAQWFGVAQRRRRVFAILDTGDWSNRPPILLEPSSLRGNSSPYRETRKEAPRGGEVDLVGGIDCECNGHGFDEPTGLLLKGSPSGGGKPLPAICIQGNMIGRSDSAGPQGIGFSEELSFTLTKTDIHGVCVPTMTSNGDAHSGFRDEDGLVFYINNQVRRLTPKECERLQGFPDNYTLVPVAKKMAKDGSRYRALGNSMAEPVMRWIGKSIQRAVDFKMSNA